MSPTLRARGAALEDVFAIQDEITENVVGCIQPEVFAAEHDRAKRKPPQSLDAWGSFVRGLEVVAPRFLEAQDSYGVSAALAYAIFVVALLGGASLPRWRAIRLLAERSYSLYLVHGPVMILVRSFLPLGDGVRLVAMLVATFAVTEVFLRLVERPSQALARRLLRQRPPAPGVEVVPER